MKTNPAKVNQPVSQPNMNRRTSFAKACLESCHTILARVRKAKESILAEARGTAEVHGQMLQLVLNEAEAVAWQTAYPHLVFPTLAMEKVSAAVTWADRQQLVNRQTR